MMEEGPKPKSDKALPMSFFQEFYEFAVSTGVPFTCEEPSRFTFSGFTLNIRLVTLAEAARGVAWEKGVTCIFEDRWNSSRELLEKRLKAHLGQFRSVFARKCEVFVPSARECEEFLKVNHIYGSTRCKYRYALRYEGKTVAVSTFSAPRPMKRPHGEVLSYEWVRFASLPDIRLSGGMGRLLEAFIRDTGAEDIMSYADLEWSDGAVYEKLGFEFVGEMPPVEFAVDPLSWQRTHLSKLCRSGAAPDAASTIIRNLGSAKYLWGCGGRVGWPTG